MREVVGLLSWMGLAASCASPSAQHSAPTMPPLSVSPATAAVPPPSTEPISRAAPGDVLVPAPPTCEPADWTPRSLPPLLQPAKARPSTSADAPTSNAPGDVGRLFEDACSDSPVGPRGDAGLFARVDGVELKLTSAHSAGTSGRRWPGNQCTFELGLADGAGMKVTLGPENVPPFNAITALVRARSAVWLVVSYNGYAREFPKGGNRIIALDLCAGRVMWQSKDSHSNTSLLLLGDYLVTAYGFTSERRFVHVFDAHSGTLVQQLPVVENVCPSKSWAPNWDGGRCDAPGQRVGAATRPRIEDGLFLVDTNTGSSTFELLRVPLEPADPRSR